MSEETPSSFQPHSDEDLARLLEEQMRIMRGGAASAPQPETPEQTESFPAAPEPEPRAEYSYAPVEPVFEVSEEDGDSAIDELFGALLEDTTDIPVVEEVVVSEVVVEQFQPVVDEVELEHTQPITTYVAAETVTAAVIEDHVVVEDVVVEEVVEDAQVIAERILTEISVDGLVVATTVAETAGADPIPQMFGEAVVAEVVEAPVVAQQPVYTPPLSVIEEVLVTEEVVEEPVAVAEAVPDEEYVPRVRSNNPLNTFAPRPSFDELVFGVHADD